MTTVKHKIAVVILMGSLLAPLLQYIVAFYKVQPLKGAITLSENVEWTYDAWKEETFQKQKDKYINDHFGFREQYVRLNNQFYFNVFKVAKANGVVVGKENYLYEENYIKDYYGINFIGKSKIETAVNKLKSIDSAFKQMNKKLIVVFAPGKASYYPEYIPDNFKRVNDTTNYKYYLSQVKKSGISYIDFNSCFVSQKSLSKKVLYPKTGIHWSDYGAILAADSINRFLAKELNYDPVEVYWTEYEYDKTKYSEVDMDIENGMNLFFQIDKPRYHYPKVKFNFDGKRKMKLLNIGDSFFWNFLNTGIAGGIFDNPSFGFYCKEFHSPLLGPPTDIANFDFKEFILKHDVVMLMATEATMNNFPFGFDNKAFNYFCSNLKDPEVYKAKLEEIKNNIKNSPEWFKAIEEKAKANNKTVEEMIAIDAEYILNNP